MAAKKYDLESSESLLKETFRESQLIYVNSYVRALIETEDFSEFSKHTKNLVIEYFSGFLNRLVAQIWQYFSANSSTPATFFDPMTVVMSKQLAKIKQQLLAKNLISDLMSEAAIRNKLESFFNEYEDRAEFKKAQNGYINIKHDFENITELTKSFRDCGQQMIKSSEILLSTYLRYKEAIFKGMGFDVVLEYYDVDNFNFVYRDPRLHDPEERRKYEIVAMNGALKALMPGYDGDISNFAEICKNIEQN
jgi:hypothetical protein